MGTRVKIALTALALAAGLFSGCSTVKPWEREKLAQPGMQLDSEPIVTMCDEHIYFSREASKGGRTFTGGGCGCN